MIGILFALCLQDTPVHRAHNLIERLRSDDFEVRESATKSLKEMGKSALPELRRAALDIDPEVRGRASLLIRTIEISGSLTPNLKKAFPGVEDRLAVGDANTWTVVFLEATAAQGGKPIHPALSTEDLSALAAPALRGARKSNEEFLVCQEIQSRRLKSAEKELVVLLGRKDVVSRKAALWALEALDARGAIADIARLLEDAAPGVRAASAQALGSLKAGTETGRVLKLLKDSHPNPRSAAASALAALGAKEYVPEVTKLLTDECSSVRANTAWSILVLAGRDAIPEVLKLLFDSDGGVRQRALEVLSSVNADLLDQDAKRLLEERDPAVRNGAAAWLCQRGSAEGAPALLDGAEDLSWLNAVRTPETWARMIKVTLSVDGGTWREALERLAGALGLKLEAPDFSWLGEDAVMGSGLTPFDLLVRPEGHTQFILEVDRLRILSHKEARDFWKAWRSGRVERK